MFHCSHRLPILWFLAFFYTTRKCQMFTSSAAFVQQCRDPDLGGQSVFTVNVRTFSVFNVDINMMCSSLRLLTDWLTHLLTDWLTDWHTDWLTDWWTDILTDCVSEWVSEWLIDRLTELHTHWLTELLTEWLSVYNKATLFSLLTSIYSFSIATAIIFLFIKK